MRPRRKATSAFPTLFKFMSHLKMLSQRRSGAGEGFRCHSTRNASPRSCHLELFERGSVDGKDSGNLEPAGISINFRQGAQLRAEATTQTAADAEIPYIEVGGPRRDVDASPSVRAAASTAGMAHAKKDSANQSAVLDSASAAGIAYRPHSTDPVFGPPAARLAAQLVAFHQPHHPVSEQYRAVLGKLVRQVGTTAPVLLMVSPVSGVGTTTAVLNLAILRAADTDCRVLVVDGNLRRPALAKQLGVAPDPGLREAIVRSIPLRRAVQETGVTGLWVLTAGTSLSEQRPWPSAEAFRSVLGELREHFDWILVDGPAWDGGPEMISLAGACDVVYLVVRPDMVGTPIVDDVARLIPPVGSHLGGYILNQR